MQSNFKQEIINLDSFLKLKNKKLIVFLARPEFSLNAKNEFPRFSIENR